MLSLFGLYEKKLLTMASRRAHSSVHASRKENYKILVSQMDVSDPENIEHENLRFKEHEVKRLCVTFVPTPKNSFCAYRI